MHSRGLLGPVRQPCFWQQPDAGDVYLASGCGAAITFDSGFDNTSGGDAGNDTRYSAGQANSFLQHEVGVTVPKTAPRTGQQG